MRDNVFIAIVLVFVLSASCPASVQAGISEHRLTVAVLWFENDASDPKEKHWVYGASGLLRSRLRKIRTIRLLSTNAVDFAYREIELEHGERPDLEQVKQLGRLIEAQRVLWGGFKSTETESMLRVKVVNTATSETSPILRATAETWFEATEDMVHQVLDHLQVTATDNERTELKQWHTRSDRTLELCAKLHWMQIVEQPLPEQERCARQAIAADPNSVLALSFLGAILANQGRFDEAGDAMRHALEIDPNKDTAHLYLGILYAQQGKMSEAQDHLTRACDLYTDDADPIALMAQLLAMERRMDRAVDLFERAVSIDPFNAETHARLAFVYTRVRQTKKARSSLKKAERLCLPGMTGLNARMMMAMAYEALGERSQALIHLQHLVDFLEQQNVPSAKKDPFRTRIQRLERSLNPHFMKHDIPRALTHHELDLYMQAKLTPGEQTMMENPLISTPEIRAWALEITQDAGDDMGKARAIFNALCQRQHTGTRLHYRTAREVFESWDDPNERFVCGDYTVLYVTMARTAGLKAFVTHVLKGPDGRRFSHACPAVFTDKGVLLVDVLWRWLGVPHQDYIILDDLQTLAIHSCLAHRSEDRILASLKLWPDNLFLRLGLVVALFNANQWDRAQDLLLSIENIPEDSYYEHILYCARGQLAIQNKQWKTAEAHLLKANAITNDTAETHYNMARALTAQGKLSDARESLRACLRCDVEPGMAEKALSILSQLNEDLWRQTQKK